MSPVRIEYLPLSTLKRWPRNPKDHDLGVLHQSISRFGFVQPLLIDERTGQLVAGHGRLDALVQMKEAGKAPPERIVAQDGEWLVPTIRGVSFVSDTEAEAYGVADNRLVELGGWNDAALATVLQDLQAAGALTFSGFDQSDLDRLLRDLMPPKEETFNVVEALRAASDLAEKVKPGQVWQLGPHRLMCGDSMKATDVARLMNGALADFLFTSPPYNVGVDYESHEDATVPWEQYGAFLRAALEAWLPVLPSGRAIGWNIGVSPKTHHVRQYVLLESLGLTFVRQMVWKKVGVPVPYWYHTVEQARARYFTPNYVHEVVWIFSKGEIEVGGPIEVDPLAEFDVFGVAQSLATVDLPPGDQHTGAKSNLERRSYKVHPSPFPVPLPRMFITHLCDVGQIVVDPFLGSGSTIIAADQVGRVCFGMEIDPLYCAVTIARWESYTGESAVPG